LQRKTPETATACRQFIDTTNAATSTLYYSAASPGNAELDHDYTAAAGRRSPLIRDAYEGTRPGAVHDAMYLSLNASEALDGERWQLRMPVSSCRRSTWRFAPAVTAGLPVKAAIRCGSTPLSFSG
jgi:hypothetical protein